MKVTEVLSSTFVTLNRALHLLLIQLLHFHHHPAIPVIVVEFSHEYPAACQHVENNTVLENDAHNEVVIVDYVFLLRSKELIHHAFDEIENSAVLQKAKGF